MHFAVGTFLWGPLLAVLSSILPSLFWFKGVVFGALAWLLMLLVTWAADPASPRRPTSNQSCSMSSLEACWDGPIAPCLTGRRARFRPAGLLRLVGEFVPDLRSRMHDDRNMSSGSSATSMEPASGRHIGRFTGRAHRQERV
jgi:hypothetical protein